MRIASLVFLLFLLPAAACGVDKIDPATAMLDAGEAYADGDYLTATRIWQDLIKGDPSKASGATVYAIYNLAQAFELGKGVQQNMQLAREYYNYAAERGLDHAQVRVGLLAQTDGKYEAALGWYLRASRGGSPVAYNNAGNLLMGAVPELADRPWGWALMSLAADARNKVAKKNLKIYEAEMSAKDLERGRMIKSLMMKCVTEGVVR